MAIEIRGIRFDLDDTESAILIQDLRDHGDDHRLAPELERSRDEIGYHVALSEDALPALHDALARIDKAAGPFPNLTKLRLSLRDEFDSTRGD